MLHKLKALAPVALGLASAVRAGDDAEPQENSTTEQSRDKWIWAADSGPSHNSYIQARKLISLPAQPARAEVKISADSRYKLYINGRYVGKGPVRSGEGYTYFDTHNVTDLLSKGKNVVAVLAHHIGERTRSYIPGRPGLICKLEIEAAGKIIEFGSDETWKARRADEWTNAGGRLNQFLGFQEVYDANGAPDGWNEVKFSEKGWENAVTVGEASDMPWGELVPRQIPQLEEKTVLPHSVVGAFNSPEVSRETPPASMPDIMAAADLSPLKAGDCKRSETLLAEAGSMEIRTPRGDRGVAVVLDFGREVFGNVEVGIAGSGTGCIDLGYGETLLEGHVKPNVGETRYTDRILLKRGKLCWQGFEPRALRYLQIEFRRCSKPVTIEYIRVNETTYPVQPVGAFECNDRLLNDIWAAGALTARLCMEDAFIDSPWRERAQWWGDARVSSRSAYYAFNDTKLLAQGLRQIASSQDKRGSVLGLYPSGEEIAAPDFALLWVFSILDYFGFTDDPELVRDLYPAVEGLLDWFSHYENADGMLEDVPGALLIDRAELERKGEVTSLNCLYYQALRVASALADIAGKEDAASDFVEKANRLKVCINKFLYVPRRGLYAEGRSDGQLVEKFSRQTNTFAALFDIADQYQKAGIFRILSNGSLPEVATPYFGSFYLEALYSVDAHDRALQYIRRKWGEMVKSGSMTLWENFSSDGALCHGSATCPARDLIAEYVGIKPVLGTHRFSVMPHIADLRWARGAVNTNYGVLTVEWHEMRNRVDIDLNVPEGLKVDVYPPGPVDTTISVDGKHWPTRVVTLSGGRHHVRVTAPRPSRAPAYDESAPSLVPHVEVLDHGIRIGRYGNPLEPRKRTRVRRKDETKLVDTPAEGAGGEPLVVSFAEAEPAEPAAETEEPKRGRRRSRGRGGRGKSAAEALAVETPSEETAAVEAATEPVVEPEGAEAPEPAEEAPHKRRRRSRGRGGRGKPTAGESPGAEAPAESALTEATADVVGEPESAEAVQSTERAPSHRRRRRSRGRGGRGRLSEAPVEETQVVDAVIEPAVQSEEVAAEPAEDAPAQRHRRRSRGRGGRGKSAIPEAATPDAISEEFVANEVMPEPVVEPAVVEIPELAEESPAPKHRRRSRGRGGRGRSAAEAPEAGSEDAAESEMATNPEPEPSRETHQEAESEQPKPKRRTYRRRSRKTESAGEGSGEPASEA